MFYKNYTSIIDIAVLILCVVFKILLNSTYTKKTERYKYLNISLTSLLIASISNVLYHYLINNIEIINKLFIYITRDIYHIALMIILIYYNLYIINLNKIQSKKTQGLLFTLLIIFSGLEILSPITKFGFYIKNNIIYEDYLFQSFTFAYITFLLFLLVIYIKHINVIVRKITYAILHIFAISVVIMIIQSFYRSTTFTTLTFLLPLILVITLLHTNSYDVEIGSLDINAFIDYFNDIKNTNFTIMQIEIKDFSTMRTQDLNILKKEIYKFCSKINYNNFSFRINENKMLFIYNEDKFNEDAMLNEFKKLYNIYALDFKIIITKNQNTFKDGYDYISFLNYMDSKIEINNIHKCNDKNIFAYLNSRYIKQELEDIMKKGDLNDERVKVYCQPVLNLETRKFTTAEALMRLELPEIGLVVPDVFIPVAERYKLIHILSKIILNKTCQYIKAHPEIERISVNFSIVEMKDKQFISDIINIISANEIPYNKIAIEITESKNTSDFNMVKEKINELKKYGLKIYLDDFGTGYSNIERIIGLPIDIIKFDKSLVMISKENKESSYMVENFAKIFDKLGYEILFEGVEDDTDEMMCYNMNASYLQGYKYSKPIPIEKLEEFN